MIDATLSTASPTIALRPNRMVRWCSRSASPYMSSFGRPRIVDTTSATARRSRSRWSPTPSTRPRSPGDRPTAARWRGPQLTRVAPPCQAGPRAAPASRPGRPHPTRRQAEWSTRRDARATTGSLAAPKGTWPRAGIRRRSTTTTETAPPRSRPTDPGWLTGWRRRGTPASPEACTTASRTPPSPAGARPRPRGCRDGCRRGRRRTGSDRRRNGSNRASRPALGPRSRIRRLRSSTRPWCRRCLPSSPAVASGATRSRDRCRASGDRYTASAS